MIVYRYINESESDVYEYNGFVDGKVVSFGLNDIKKWVEYCVKLLNKKFPTSIGIMLSRKPIVYTRLVDAMATDGINIFINPDFVADMFLGAYPMIKPGLSGDTLNMIMYVLCHEVLHIMFRHPYEEKSDTNISDHNKANVSQDCVINLYIEHILAAVFPEFKGMNEYLGMVYDTNYKDMAWKDIYKKLPDDYPFLLAREKEKHSAEWERGFSDGYRRAIELLRDEKLIERCVL